MVLDSPLKVNHDCHDGLVFPRAFEDVRLMGLEPLGNDKGEVSSLRLGVEEDGFQIVSAIESQSWAELVDKANIPTDEPNLVSLEVNDKSVVMFPALRDLRRKKSVEDNLKDKVAAGCQMMLRKL
ncbi:hypothetical protein V6N13_009791 [Hibiscus sabdariffa]